MRRPSSKVIVGCASGSSKSTFGFAFVVVVVVVVGVGLLLFVDTKGGDASELLPPLPLLLLLLLPRVVS